MATYWENSCSFGLRYVSWYKCLIVSLFFSHLGFWSGNLFLIAPFPDLCLLVPSNITTKVSKKACTYRWFYLSHFPGQAPTRVVNQQSVGRSVVYKLWLEAQSARLFL